MNMQCTRKSTEHNMKRCERVKTEEFVYLTIVLEKTLEGMLPEKNSLKVSIWTEN